MKKNILIIVLVISIALFVIAEKSPFFGTVDSTVAHTPILVNATDKSLSVSKTEKSRALMQKIYLDNNYGFEVKYPADWLLMESTTTVKNLLSKEIKLSKLGYTIFIDTSTESFGGGMLNPGETYTVLVGEINNKKIFRSYYPIEEEYNSDKYFRLVAYEKSNDVYGKKMDQFSYSLNSNNTFYSIRYMVPDGVGVNNYNKEIINEADLIVSTLKFSQ